MKSYLLTLLFAVLSLLSVSCSGKSDQQSENQLVMNSTTDRHPKSVLILSSSPRRGGNSETLCMQFRKGAKEAGHRVEMINLNDYDIRYFNQKEYDRAVSATETDDAARIIAKMKSADVIVLSSPVYFYILLSAKL